MICYQPGFDPSRRSAPDIEIRTIPDKETTTRKPLPTPKALHPTAQGRVAVKPQSAPWVTTPTTHIYAEGVTQMTAPTVHHRHDHKTGQRRPRCITPSAYGMRGAHDHPGCATNDDHVVSRRPWPLEYNRFAVKRPWHAKPASRILTPEPQHPYPDT